MRKDSQSQQVQDSFAQAQSLQGGSLPFSGSGDLCIQQESKQESILASTQSQSQHSQQVFFSQLNETPQKIMHSEPSSQSNQAEASEVTQLLWLPPSSWPAIPAFPLNGEAAPKAKSVHSGPAIATMEANSSEEGEAPFSIISYNQAIPAGAGEGQPVTSFSSAIRDVQEEGHPSTISYNTAISACTEKGPLSSTSFLSAIVAESTASGRTSPPGASYYGPARTMDGLQHGSCHPSLGGAAHAFRFAKPRPASAEQHSLPCTPDVWQSNGDQMIFGANTLKHVRFSEDVFVFGAKPLQANHRASIIMSSAVLICKTKMSFPLRRRFYSLEQQQIKDAFEQICYLIERVNCQHSAANIMTKCAQLSFQDAIYLIALGSMQIKKEHVKAALLTTPIWHLVAYNRQLILQQFAPLLQAQASFPSQAVASNPYSGISFYDLEPEEWSDDASSAYECSDQY